MDDNILVTIYSEYHRSQFDDWLADGAVEFEGKTYYWSAQDSNYGFGWEIEPIGEEPSCLDEDKFDELASIVEGCLHRHRTEYVVRRR